MRKGERDRERDRLKDRQTDRLGDREREGDRDRDREREGGGGGSEGGRKTDGLTNGGTEKFRILSRDNFTEASRWSPHILAMQPQTDDPSVQTWLTAWGPDFPHAWGTLTEVLPTASSWIIRAVWCCFISRSVPRCLKRLTYTRRAVVAACHSLRDAIPGFFHILAKKPNKYKQWRTSLLPSIKPPWPPWKF